MLNPRPYVFNRPANKMMPARVRPPRRVVLERIERLDSQVVTIRRTKKGQGRGEDKNKIALAVPLKRYGLIDHSRYNGAALREIRKTHR